MKRLPGLDLMRAIAIGLVLWNHLGSVLLGPHPNATRQWWLTGPLGVDLFFALSGYLIGRILLNLEKSIPSPQGLVSFWSRRWLRTLPSYYLFLGINLLIVAPSQGLSQRFLQKVIPYLYFGQTFHSRPYPFFTESWSLAVEEFFYLSFPFIWAVVIRVGVRPVVAFLSCALVMLLLPLMLRLQLDPGIPRFWITDVYDITVFRLDGIAFGVLAAALSLRAPKLWARWSYPGLILGVFLLILDWLILTDEKANPFGFMLVWHFSVNGLGRALLLPWCSRLGSLGVAGIERAVGAVARWSYSLYLVNLPVIVALKGIFRIGPGDSLLRTFAMAAAFLATSLLASAMLYRFLEKPILTFREHWKPAALKAPEHP